MTTMQTTSPIVHTSFQAGARSAQEIVRMANNGHIDLCPGYQRGSVWTRRMRQDLVRSWLTGLPIPAIIMNARWGRTWSSPDDDDVEYGVVDGKQRIEAAVAWFGGQFSVPASWFNPDLVETTIDTVDGPYVVFSGLTTPGQRVMSNRASLPLLEVHLPDVAAEAAMYDLVNTSGVPQTEGDLARARTVASA